MRKTQTKVYKVQKEYWEKELSGEIPVLELPLDQIRKSDREYEVAVRTIELKKEILCEVEKIAEKARTTNFVIMLAAYNILLSKYTGQEDIIVGIPAADLENHFCMDVGVLPIRTRVTGVKTISEYIVEVKEKVENGIINQNYFLEEMIETKNIQNPSEHNSLFNVMFEIQNKLQESTMKESRLIHDLTFVISIGAKSSISAEYLKGLFNEQTIEKMVIHYQHILDQIVENSHLLISEIELITEKEKREIINIFNNTKVDFQRNVSYHELFREAVKKYPDNIAIKFKPSYDQPNEREQVYSYKELDEITDCLASLLRKKGVERESIVPIVVERSADIVVGAIAVMKAGGAYMPIDPGNPLARIQYFLNETKAEVLLVQPWLLDKVSDFKGELIDITSIPDRADFSYPKNINEENDLCSIIYTSGTTGVPKGVQIVHRALTNLSYNQVKTHNYSSHSCMVDLSSFTFVASIFSIFPMLTSGGTVHILSQSQRKDMDQVTDIARKATDWVIPTPIYKSLSEEQVKKLRKVKLLLGAAKMLKIDEHASNVVNVYGCSEFVGPVTEYNVTGKEDSIPAGKPIANTKIYIVDKDERLCPIGIAGEICISGRQISRGYFNNPELTIQKFVHNPFNMDNDNDYDIMYHTGDMAKWLPDGNIEYIGRIDFQVKIRGFRIEPSEIEAVILKNQDVKETVVASREDQWGNNYLVGYYVSKSVTEEQIRKKLAEELPDYMIPQFLMKLEKMPLTANNKIDRRALPEPILQLEAYIEPHTHNQKQLTVLWGEILGIDPYKIGIRDNFFNLGGDSLKAISLSAKIRKEMGWELKAGQIFQLTTVEEQSKAMDHNQRGHLTRFKKVRNKKAYYATNAQKRIYLANQLRNEDTAYNVPQIFRISKNLNIEKLKIALQKITDTQKSLRVFFDETDGEIKQKLLDQIDIDIDAKTITQEQIENTIHHFIKPFDLKKGPLWRFELYKIEEINEWLFLLDFHHTIFDGYSNEIFMTMLKDAYEGNTFDQPEVEYTDYAEWEACYTKSKEFKEQGQYWEKELSGELPVLEIPTDYIRSVKRTFESGMIEKNMKDEMKAGIQKIAEKEATTPFVIMLAAYNILLSKYARQDDVIVGIPTLGRAYPGLEKTIGMFVGTLPIRTEVGREKTLIAYIREVKEKVVHGLNNQEYPLEEMVASAKVQRSLGHNALFDVMFALSEHMQEGISLGEAYLQPIGEGETKLKHDLTFSIDNSLEYSITAEYAKELFTQETIHRMMAHYETILSAIIKDRNQLIAETELTTGEEKEEIIKIFNSTEEDYPRNAVYYECFRDAVKKYPDNKAVIFKPSEGETNEREQSYTYRELDEITENLAAVLRERGVGKDSIVAIMVERSADIIVGALAVMKAGGAYLPIDPEYPETRIEYMLSDCGAKLILTQPWLNNKVDKFKGDVIDITQIPITKNEKPLDNINTENDLCYIIYTSGSTGQPKGVMIEHKGVCNLGYTQQAAFKTDEKSIICEHVSFSFDTAVYTLFLPLMYGACVHILNHERRYDLHKMHEYINEHKIQMIDLPTQLCVQYYEQYHESYLKYLITGGEALKVETKKRPYKLVNEYGPTENTVSSTRLIIHEGENISIGKPIANTKIYIVNEAEKLCPVGVPGELCISGRQLSRGYLNRPELTAEKFVTNPFNKDNKDYEKMYKTGDLARWLPDGNIEFLGRIDFQVKIRGFRVELGEIETVMLKQEGIRETVVIAKEDKEGNSYLIGYYVSEKKNSGEEELRKQLGRELPDYMIPQYLVSLEKLPLTVNGKIDRKALPEPELKQQEYMAPRTETEKKLAEIWSQVLGVSADKISIKDNFFHMGGNSIKVISLSAKVRNELGTDIQIAQFFRFYTIEEQAMVIERIKNDAVFSRKTMNFKKVQKKDRYEASNAQKRVYIANKLRGDSTAYNIPQAFCLTGSINIEKLQKSIQLITNFQTSLRTCFEEIDGTIKQKVIDQLEILLEEKIISEDAIGDTISQFVRPFDLEKAPLWRVELYRVECKNQWLLLTDFHHSIFDGQSHEIFMKYLIAAYEGKKLKEPQVQYVDYAEWEADYMNSKEYQEQEDYWKKELSGEVSTLELLKDFMPSSERTYDSGNQTKQLEPSVARGIEKIAEKEGTTPFVVMLAAYKILLSKYGRQEDIVVGIPALGRAYAGLEETIGMFVGTLPIRTFVGSEKAIDEYIRDVKEKVINGLNNQDYPLEEMIASADLQRVSGRNALFDVMFAQWEGTQEHVKLDKARMEPIAGVSIKAKYELTLSIDTNREVPFIFCEYAKELFKEERIDKMLEHYECIIEQIIENSTQTLGEIGLIAKAEKEKILKEFNETEAEFERGKNYHDIFRETAEKYPDNMAVVFKPPGNNPEEREQRYTYRELDEITDRFAALLREKGIGRESVVPIMVERSADIIIGALSVMKAGGAYLAIDPNYPKERKNFLLKDSSAQLILTQKRLKHRELEDYEIETILLDEEPLALARTMENINAENDTAVIVYTSGSTGKPKGSLLTHDNLLNFCCWEQATYPIQSTDKSAEYASFTFDISMHTLLSHLASGACCYIIPEQTRFSIIDLETYIEENQITLLTLPTPIGEEYIMQGKNTTLRRLTVAGEKLKVYKQNSYELINAYGPSEYTIYTTHKKVTEYEQNIPIGKPVANTKIYITDQNGNLCPIGMPGELCISGRQLSKGYLNRPELTAEKFADNPFNTANHKDYDKMYRTGDLVRWLPDGNIEFLGRIDFQVKIRGFRIELGEIETVMLKQAGMKEAVVVSKEDQKGSSYLVGYYVSGETKVTEEAVREWLRKELPEYMVPQYLAKLKKLPLTVNGKIDRKALPEPELKAEKYIGPRTETEEKLTEIWSQVLGMPEDKISIRDNYFNLGGDSIKGIQMVSKAKKQGMVIRVKDVFENLTIEGLARVAEKQEQKMVQAEQGKIEGEFQLIPIQKWFFEQEFKAQNHWNQSVMIKTGEAVDKNRLEAVIHKIIERHDALRLRFQKDMAGKWYQRYSFDIEHGKIEIKEADIQKNKDQKKAMEKLGTKWQSDFDIEKGNIMSVGIIRGHKDGQDRIHMAIHHLMVDGISWRILLSDMEALYQGKEIGEKTSSYKDWEEALRKYGQREKVKETRTYWEKTEDVLKTIKKPAVKNKSTGNRLDTEILTVKIDKETTENLLNQSNQAYNTQINDLLLTAFAGSICQWSGDKEAVIEMEGHGREDIDEEIDLSSTVGWFTIQYPLHLKIDVREDIGEQIKDIKEQNRKIPDKGMGYGVLRYQDDVENNLKETPYISFNYLGNFKGGEGKGWCLDFEGSGEALDKGNHNSGLLINVNGYETENGFEFGFAYSKAHFSMEEMQQIGKRFEERLGEIAIHCEEQDETEKTVSDYGF